MYARKHKFLLQEKTNLYFVQSILIIRTLFSELQHQTNRQTIFTHAIIHTHIWLHTNRYDILQTHTHFDTQN